MGQVLGADKVRELMGERRGLPRQARELRQKRG